MSEGAMHGGVPRAGLERAALKVAWRHRRLWVFHAFANAFLLWLAYWALGFPDEKLWQVAAFFLVAGVALVGAPVLHGGTLVFLRWLHEGRPARIEAALGNATRRLPALALWAAILFGIIWLADWSERVRPDRADWLASYLTLHLRRPVKPEGVEKVLDWIAWFIEWVVVPLMILPLAAAVAEYGFGGYGRRGWRGVWKVIGRWRCWLGILVLYAAGVALPAKLAAWVPKLPGFWMEVASAVLRLGLAYAILIAVWLVTASWIGCATAAETHPPE